MKIETRLRLNTLLLTVIVLLIGLILFNIFQKEKRGRLKGCPFFLLTKKQYFYILLVKSFIPVFYTLIYWINEICNT